MALCQYPHKLENSTMLGGAAHHGLGGRYVGVDDSLRIRKISSYPHRLRDAEFFRLGPSKLQDQSRPPISFIPSILFYLLLERRVNEVYI